MNTSRSVAGLSSETSKRGVLSAPKYSQPRTLSPVTRSTKNPVGSSRENASRCEPRKSSSTRQANRKPSSRTSKIASDWAVRLWSIAACAVVGFHWRLSSPAGPNTVDINSAGAISIERWSASDDKRTSAASFSPVRSRLRVKPTGNFAETVRHPPKRLSRSLTLKSNTFWPFSRSCNNTTLDCGDRCGAALFDCASSAVGIANSN